MPYELYNPHPNRMRIAFPQPIGEIEIGSQQAVPTPEQEANGLYVRHLQDHKGPSFLVDTPPAIRRRLLEAARLSVPEDVLRRTRHLPEYRGAALPPLQAPAGALPAGTTSGGAGAAVPPGRGEATSPRTGGSSIEEMSSLLVPVAAGVPQAGGLDETSEALRQHLDRAASSFKGPAGKRPDKV